MSLKAKIEAVIYAAEEPVTLAQLAGLLGQEAQAELDARESAQQSLSLNETELDLEDAGDAQDAAPADAEALPFPLTPRAAEAHGEGVGEASGDLLVGRDGGATEPLPDGQPAIDEGLAAARAAARAEKEAARRLREYFRDVTAQLVAEYAGPERGLEIREVAGGYRFATKPEYHDAVRGFVRSLKPPLKLTLQALETLAVVAYKQPVTAPEISEIRGVDSGGVLGSLMARKLITTAGRKQVIGRPILYKTTRDFLMKFGLKDVAELPSIEEFEKMAGELADAEPMQEEIPMEHTAPETADELDPEKDRHEPQADGDSRRAEDGDVDAAAEEGAEVDRASVDGRISGLPPVYDDAADDPSAQEAAEQESSNET
jgi:segregation and condensation protein B